MSTSLMPQVASLNGKLASITLSQPVSTPTDYAKFAFPLPEQRYVGLLACQRDPNLRELETLVTSCKKKTDAAVARSNGKEKGKQKKAAAKEEELWEVELLDTPLFPEGGGQASDTGSLLLLDEKEAQSIIVKEVIRRHLAAVHMCTAPVPVNARVSARVDWARRHDLSTQHTSQHALSAVLEQHFDLPTLGWALSAYPNLSYVELPRCPTKGELSETERICNELIVEGRRVRIEMELLEDHNRPENLPDDYVGGGVARTVIIDGLDTNPCCGTHYHSLAPLQGIHVSPFTTPVRGTNTRVYFMAGPRISAQLAVSLASLREAGAQLSSSSEDVPKRVQLLLDNAKDSRSKEKRMRDELADFVARKLFDQVSAQAQDGPLVGALVREEESTNDIDFLNQLSFKLKDLAGEKAYSFALGQCGGSVVGEPDGCLLVFASDEALVQKVAAQIKKGETSLTKRLRGGGKGRWQGKLSEGRLRPADETELLSLLRDASV